MVRGEKGYEIGFVWLRRFFVERAAGLVLASRNEESVPFVLSEPSREMSKLEDLRAGVYVPRRVQVFTSGARDSLETNPRRRFGPKSQKLSGTEDGTILDAPEMYELLEEWGRGVRLKEKKRDLSKTQKPHASGRSREFLKRPLKAQCGGHD